MRALEMPESLSIRMSNLEQPRVSTNVSGLVAFTRFFAGVGSTKESSDFSFAQHFNYSLDRHICTPCWVFPVKASISQDAITFLSQNGHLLFALAHASEAVESLLAEKGIDASQHISLGSDVESPDWSALVMHYSLKNMDYSELLDLWDEACRRAYAGLKPDAACKIVIVFDETIE